MAAGQAVSAHQDEALDALVWRATGKCAGALEAVLAANPGLAAMGDVLPEGAVVFIPAAAVEPVSRPLIQLWD